MIRGSLSILSAAVAALTIATVSARAEGGIEAGMLQCRGGATTSFVVGSVSSFDCLLQPSYGGPPQHYVANVRRAGVDIGVTQEAVLGWIVFAPSRAVGPGALSGGYGGASAIATVGVGAGVNALIGGMDNSFALQPVSLQGQTGLNVAATLTGIDLQYVPPGPPPRHHRHRH